MKTSIKLLDETFVSSSGLTPQFAKFYSTFTNELRKFLKAKGCTEIDFSKGHFCISGFFTAPNGQIWYIDFGDVRWSMGSKYRMLYRTATSYKDYTGGTNQYVEITQLDNWNIFNK